MESQAIIDSLQYDFDSHNNLDRKQLRNFYHNKLFRKKPKNNFIYFELCTVGS